MSLQPLRLALPFVSSFALSAVATFSGLAAPAAAQSPPAAGPAQAPPAVTAVPDVAGAALRQAVARVAALEWFDDLADAKARSASTGKPILWLQALGDLEGFA